MTPPDPGWSVGNFSKGRDRSYTSMLLSDHLFLYYIFLVLVYALQKYKEGLYTKRELTIDWGFWTGQKWRTGTSPFFLIHYTTGASVNPYL